jgi:dihydroflavonol-4-reductase
MTVAADPRDGVQAWPSASLRVGVIGASGAIGHDVVPDLLDRFASVVALLEPLQALDPTVAAADSVEVRHADITDPSNLVRAVRGLDVVVNLAGLPSPLGIHERAMWRINAIGAHNVARAAVAAGVQTLVHVSSTAAVGYPPDGIVADEDFVFTNSVTTSAYAITKRHGEDLVADACAGRMRLVILNPAAVLSSTGRPEYGWAPLLRSIARARVVPVPTGGSSFCGPADVADVLLRALARGRDGARYIVVSENLTYADLFARVRKLAGRPPRSVTVAPVVGRAAAVLSGLAGRLTPGPGPRLDAGMADLMSRRLFYRAGRARSELGFVARPVNADIEAILHPPAEAAR